VTEAPGSAPAGFLRLAGHPLRWRLLAEALLGQLGGDAIEAASAAELRTRIGFLLGLIGHGG